MTYFTGWLKKKKSHEIRDLEIDAERPVTPPRPGWHRQCSFPGSRWGDPRAGLAFSTTAAVQQGGGSEPEDGAVLMKSTSQQLWELSSEEP